jgi:hypothetical protein
LISQQAVAPQVRPRSAKEAKKSCPNGRRAMMALEVAAAGGGLYAELAIIGFLEREIAQQFWKKGTH